MNDHKKFPAILLFLCLILPGSALAQQPAQSSNKLQTWLIFQALPSFSWTTFPSETHFSFEWEATPILYSFGMTRLVSPWNFFFVTPPARFAGSIELTVSGQVLTSKVGSSHFAYSGQLLGHFPLMERGEELGLNLGVATYQYQTGTCTLGVVGVSTLFGFVHYNLKLNPNKHIWMNSLEFRVF
ncbi:MAG: hypothetical protein WBD36_06925 [Bacteroidota bacterium]